MNFPEISAKTLDVLQRLGRFWIFSRRSLALSVLADIQAWQQRARDYHSKELAEAAERERCLIIERDYQKEHFEKLQLRLADAAERIGNLEAVVSQSGRQIESDRHTIATLLELNQTSEAARATLNNDYMTLSEKFGLVSSVLSQKADNNNGLDDFQRLLNDDYLGFASRCARLVSGAEPMLALQSIFDELSLVVRFPASKSRTLLAVAGGFSSGKSQFINSYIASGEVALAVGINPVTVLPSYVVCGETVEVRGHSAKGGSFELGAALYASLGHEFLESFGFDLRDIMPFLSVQVPMDRDLFGNICLIDTPGYNPGYGRAVESDRKVSRSMISQAKAIVWVIGLGTDGTITQADLEFIENVRGEGQMLYVILNKADLKSQSSIESIMDEVCDKLESYCFEFSGICAYSSIKRSFYGSRGELLEDFLRSLNIRHDIFGEIESRIDGVFDQFRSAIDEGLGYLGRCRKGMNVLQTKIIEVGGSGLYEEMNGLCKVVEDGFYSEDIDMLLGDCERLCKRFKTAARDALNGSNVGQ
jgi:hypothetical protein